MNELKKVVALIVLTGLLFVGGYLYLSRTFLEQAIAPAPHLASTTSQAPKTKAFTLSVVGRKLVSGDTTLKVKEGEKVIINITVDEDEELHLHGYDVHIDLKKDQQGTLTLVTSSSGRFPFELEHSGTELGALEVLP